MSDGKKVLAIDAGNTALKIGLFINDALSGIVRHSLDNQEALSEFIKGNADADIVISSVLSSKDTSEILNLTDGKVIVIDQRSKFPVSLQYETKETLGVDRICNAVALSTILSTNYGVVIDIGTCIKFDLIDNRGNYYGGSISPGIDLRFRSLNDYTGNLPLISNKKNTDLVGISTETSIRSGVMNGMKSEIEGMMSWYSERYKDLTFFVTGGDAMYFDLQSKNNIFADENLTLKGLYELYKVNI